jgi:hypothetical protein
VQPSGHRVDRDEGTAGVRQEHDEEGEAARRLRRPGEDADAGGDVSAALGQGVFDQPDSADGEFGFGLERVLDGIDVLVRSRTR